MLTPQLVHFSFTVADTGKPTKLDPLIFVDVDFQCLTNAVDCGDRNAQSFQLAVGDTLSYRNAEGIDIRQIYFKNHTPASAGVIVVTGVLKGGRP